MIDMVVEIMLEDFNFIVMFCFVTLLVGYLLRKPVIIFFLTIVNLIYFVTLLNASITEDFANIDKDIFGLLLIATVILLNGIILQTEYEKFKGEE